MSHILIFDIPRENKTLATRVFRSLKAIGAKLVQFSVWQHNDLNSLIAIAMMIKNHGGSARILREEFVF